MTMIICFSTFWLLICRKRGNSPAVLQGLVQPQPHPGAGAGGWRDSADHCWSQEEIHGKEEKTAAAGDDQANCHHHSGQGERGFLLEPNTIFRQLNWRWRGGGGDRPLPTWGPLPPPHYNKSPFKGIVSRDFGGLQMISMNRIWVRDVPLEIIYFFFFSSFSLSYLSSKFWAG